jgi:hypothetical protein
MKMAKDLTLISVILICDQLQKSETRLGLSHPCSKRKLQELCRVLTSRAGRAWRSQKQPKENEGLFACIASRSSHDFKILWRTSLAAYFEIIFFGNVYQPLCKNKYQYQQLFT